MIVVGSTYWNMGYGMNKDEVLQDGEGLQAISNLGKNMAWLIKSIDGSKETARSPEISMEVMTNFIR